MSKLYKYKQLTKIDDLDYLIDIIKNKRMYMPTYSQVNDPLEGFSLIPPTGLMGSGLSHSVGFHHPVEIGYLSRYRMLCLSEISDSPPMWAHYTNSGMGICLEFEKSNSFDDFKAIEYVQNDFVQEYTLVEGEELEKNARDALMRKKSDWSYESELRLLRKIEDRQDNEFFSFSDTDLKSIIIGYNLKQHIILLICAIAKKYSIKVKYAVIKPHFGNIEISDVK